ncbi:MAG TPA: P1 family peptidase [Caulobacteraceae bacterium]|jgi:L-aminopeptidase/D-esterase-like protein
MRSAGIVAAAFGAIVLSAPASAEEPKARARDLGVPFEGTLGPLNAITDVAGVEVGHVTLLRGSGPLVVGKGPVRTGVTAVLPRGKQSTTPVFGAWFTLNAAGEMTGTTWLEERGQLDGPILITNTHSVGVVRDAAVAWMVKSGWPAEWHTPVVAETWDGVLNDLNGFHVRQEHALRAIESARAGPVEEGAVGGGTGMICSRFKGGIGTASRRLPAADGGYTVGVLVQCNYGARGILRVAGAPVGEALKDRYLPCYTATAPAKRRFPFADCAARTAAADPAAEPENADGSIIVVVATDAPLLPHQLKRLAKRPSLGLGRLGSIASDGSGDIFVAFSTANPQIRSVQDQPGATAVQMHPNDRLSPLFEAVVQATEEAVVNAMIAARTMEGADGLRVYGLPHEELRAILRRHGRLTPRAGGGG